MNPFKLIRGFRGHPSHPPLTDATIGAYTAGTVLVVLAWLGVAPDRLADAGLLAMLVGLGFAVPTAVTGFADYLGLDRGSPARGTALIHMFVMLSATVLYAVSAYALYAGPDDGVSAMAGILTVTAFVTLTVGGWIGGSLVFVHAIRVLDHERASSADAIAPKLPPD